MLKLASLLALLTLGLLLAAGSATTENGSGKARHVSSHTIRNPALSFGGLSAIEIDDSGTRFTILSDRGFVASGRLLRDGQGRIDALTDISTAPLRAISGRKLKLWERDAEGLALTPNGALTVSFEGFHRVRLYPEPTSPAQPLPDSPIFSSFEDNAGLEALAIDPKGRLLAIPENFGRGAPFPLLRLEKGHWRKIADIPRRGPFLPTGADVGPDGALYLLERDFVWYRGFRSRVRRFRLDVGGLSREETLFETPFGRHDNLEGIAVWPSGSKRLRLTLISDDNANWAQRSEIVEYEVAPLEAPPISAATSGEDLRAEGKAMPQAGGLAK